jgi:hypothetical protein
MKTLCGEMKMKQNSYIVFVLLCGGKNMYKVNLNERHIEFSHAVTFLQIVFRAVMILPLFFLRGYLLTSHKFHGIK